MEGSEEEKKAQYTLPGVIYFLQQESRKFEKEKAEWTVEKATLKTKITHLEGEKLALQNLNNDLLRRIKMLEYALKQERAKYVTGIRDPAFKEVPPKDPLFNRADFIQSPTARTPVATGKVTRNQKTRLVLQRYIAEMANTDRLTFNNPPPSAPLNYPLDYQPYREDGRHFAKIESYVPQYPEARGFEADISDGTQTVRANEPRKEDQSKIQDLFTNDKAKAATRKIIEQQESEGEKIIQGDDDDIVEDTKTEDEEVKREGKENEKENEEEQKENEPEKESEKADEREEPEQKKSGKSQEAEKTKSDDDQIQEDIQKKIESNSRWKKMMQEFDPSHKPEGKSKKGKVKVTSLFNDEEGKDKPQEIAKKKIGDLEDLGNISIDEQEAKSQAEAKDVDTFTAKQWKPKSTLRSHLDSVRVLGFREHENVLLSASEDGTIKIWNTGALPTGKKQPEPEPFFTFRGHQSMVLSMTISDIKGGEAVCYSGSADGSIRSWKIPPANYPIYSPFDYKYSWEIVAENLDAVWHLKAHPVRNILASASSNSMVKIWSPETKKTLITLEKIEPANPTCVDFVHTDLKKIAVSYTNSNARVFDIETGKSILALESNSTYDKTPQTQINQIIAHPTLPLAISAHEDKYIRFFDLNSGKCVNSMIAHLDSVSCLAIHPSGLSLVSGGHDSSIRFWDIKTYSCLQEFTSHRKKYNEGVLSLAFHPTASILASSGADATVKIYT